jgi:uroporphyrinogen decarboxylase
MFSEDQKWIKDTLAHKDTGRVPYHFDFTPPAKRILEKYYGSTDLNNIIGLPIRWGGPRTIKPLYADTETYGDRLKDEFGVTWAVSDNDRGTPMPCLHEPDLSDYRFPDPHETYRFEYLDEWCKENSQHYRLIWPGDLWERATFIRGMEHLLIDVMTDRDFVKELLRGIADYYLETMKIINDRFEFEAFGLSDDYGTQKNLIMSPEDWRDVVKPYLSEIGELAEKMGKDLMIHSCGNIYSVIGDLIEAGIDIIHPIQPETMDIYKIKKEFGNDATFQGGLNTQELLPFGSPEEIRKEMRKLKKEMGENGGFILEPGITVQGDIPLDNLIAMIDEAKIP